MIIAIDGPAASGKGTLAKRIAAHYGYAYLDTGVLYRAVGRDVLKAGRSLEDVSAAAEAARSLDISTFDDPELRSTTISDAASKVAVIPAVREALMQMQKNFPQGKSGAVIEGRDIGTAIFPDADAKLYITASLEERARRRFAELAAAGENITYEAIYADLEARDLRDQSRVVSPLRIAEDADLLDTTKLDIEAALFAAVRLIDAAMDRSKCAFG
ncbi:MAG: (d)CMP kinase [Alphaproteobacteria bacterium]